MKTALFLLLSAIFMATTASAQTPAAEIKVSYVERYVSHRGDSLTRIFRLLANSSQSKFCHPISEQTDSLLASPGGKEKYYEMVLSAVTSGAKIPKAPSSLYVFHDIATQTATVYDQAVSDKYFYSEPWTELQWLVADTTKTVLGYDCIMATADYHGRKWTAWFAPDIPLPLGPWKLCGLPGLILEAAEASGTYSFTADGIERTDAAIIPMMSANDYSKADRKEMLATARKFLEDPIAAINAQYGDTDNLKIIGDIMPKIAEGWDYLETDYH